MNMNELSKYKLNCMNNDISFNKFTHIIYDYIANKIDRDKYSVAFIWYNDIAIYDEFRISEITIPMTILYNRYNKDKFTKERIISRIDKMIKPYTEINEDKNIYNLYKDILNYIIDLLNKYNLEINILVIKNNSCENSISYYRHKNASRYGFSINIKDIYNLYKEDDNYLENTLYKEIENKIIEVYEILKKENK